MDSLLHKASLVLLALLCLAAASCDLDFLKNSSPIIAEVENTRLYISDLKRIKIEGDSVSAEQWIHYIEDWVNLEVMYREALKRGLQNDPATQRLVKNAEKKIIVDRLKLTLDSSVAIDSDNELSDYYENNKELFRIDSIDSVSYIPYSDVKERIQRTILSEKRMNKEKKWLTETKNLYSIEIYPQYLKSLQ